MHQPFPLQLTWDPKQTSIAAQGTRHPTNKHRFAHLRQVENKAASPEVEEKAEFEAGSQKPIRFTSGQYEMIPLTG